MKKSICLILFGWLAGILSTIVFLIIVPSQEVQKESKEVYEVDSCAVDYNAPYYKSKAFHEKMTMGVGGE